MGFVTLTCSGCGQPIELDDSREFGFCSYCGTKMMIDRIIVEHKGSVKLDNSDIAPRAMQTARIALTKEDWAEVERNYGIAQQYIPNCIEAVVLSSLGGAMLFMGTPNYAGRYQKFNILCNSFKVINDYYEVTDEDKEKVIKTIGANVEKLMNSPYVYEVSSIYATDIFGRGIGQKRWGKKLKESVNEAFLEQLYILDENYDEPYVRRLIERHERIKPKKR